MTWGTQYSTHQSCSYSERSSSSTSSVSPLKQTKTNCTKWNRQHTLFLSAQQISPFSQAWAMKGAFGPCKGLEGRRRGCCVQVDGKSWASRLATARLQMTGDNKCTKCPQAALRKVQGSPFDLPTPGVYRALRHNPSVRSLHSVTCRALPSALR